MIMRASQVHKFDDFPKKEFKAGKKAFNQKRTAISIGCQ